ncbi:MAG: class I SAM-dependent methyltransferase [Rhodospirillales bacterium]
MDRIEILQRVATALNARHYLEIGVSKGESFFPLRIARKVAVDPHPRLSWRKRLRNCLGNPLNLFNAYYPVASDEYFARVRPPPGGFDLVFIDGLHTYEQALRDTLNALKVLKPGGVVALHDCNPPHAAAGFPARSYEDAAAARPPGWTGEWCGDVWKAIVHLRAFHPELDVAVLDCDYGVGLVRRGRPAAAAPPDADGLRDWDYSRLAAARSELLNLKPPVYLDAWLAGLDKVN